MTRQLAGLAWINLASGEFRVCEVAPPKLAATLERIRPAEIVVPESLSTEFTAAVALTRRPDWHFDVEAAGRELRAHFGTTSLAGFGADGLRPAIAAAGALLRYAQATQTRALPHLRALIVERDATLSGPGHRHPAQPRTDRNPARPAGADAVQPARQLRQRHGLAAAAACAAPPLARSGDPDRPTRRNRHAARRRGVHATCAAPGLRAFADIERIAGRIALCSARPRDLSSLRDSVQQLETLRAPLRDSAAPLLAELHAQLATPLAALELLQRAILPEPASLLRDGGVIASGFDAELDELRALNDNCGAFLLALEARERERTGIANLKVEYNRVHGFFIEVSNAQATRVPDDYRRRQTLKNAERYLTPELKAFEDKALSAKDRSLAREKLLYDEVLAELQSELPRLQQIAQAVAYLDLLAAFADSAQRHNYCRPLFSSEPGLSIEGGRHPVVEDQLPGGASFIANDTRLGDGRRLLLITGPNMGGKSTYMRQTALIALLAHVGSYVPASSAVLGPLDQIFTRIGAADDLAAGRSTFMVEMTESAAILHHATERSLVLMDEVGRGTSTFDGMALAFAICRHLLEKNRCLTLFATHYFELTLLANEYGDLANVHLGAVEHGERIVFLHAVEEGPASQSYGIQVAALAGIPSPVLRAARRQLREFEQRASINPLQPDLFASALANAADASEPAIEPALERLRSVDPDQLTPREALDALYELKALLQ
jgi:DNA mismatch repair protein MutS